MEKKVNSYFQLVFKEEKAYIKILPPVNTGKLLNIKEVIEYLTERGLTKYDLKELNQAVTVPADSQPVYVGEHGGFAVNEVMKIIVSPDNMLVYGRFYPSAGGGTNMTKEEMEGDLQAKKIVYGVDGEILEKLTKKKHYCRNYLIAKGMEPVQGTDAKINYAFSTNISLKPKHNEDGSVDYHDLNTIRKVEKGGLLAELIPAVHGKNGMNVLGEELKARDVRERSLSYGKDISISEDGTKIYSDITGHISMDQDKVEVSGIYEVPADVDNSTGDIDFPGNVVIHGNVKGGFIVRAGGDILVEGVVENAELYAGGQIIVKRGINGMNRGILDAKGNIIIKFIENAKVKSGGYIETETIIQSKVYANSNVTVSGSKGFIMGGEVHAGAVVEAETIGSSMGTLTHIQVGIEPEKQERHGELQKELKELTKKVDQIKPILTTYSAKLSKGEALPKDKMSYMKTLVAEYKNVQMNIASLQAENEMLQAELLASNRAKVKVNRQIFQGVRIQISDLSIETKDGYKYCQFVKDNGDIKVRNL